MSFSNRIRLPFKLHKPQFLEDANRYRKANGVTVTLSVVVRKVYEGLTDSIPEKLHERLKIALVHDSVQVEGDKYVGVIAQEGDYQIEWQDFLSHPLAQGKFKAEVTPFNATNSNCGTCEEMIQVVCNDDFVGTVDADTDYNVGVIGNDNICCSPITQTIVSFNSTYISAIVTNPDYRITFHVAPTAPSGTGIIIARYRIQCANGQFDEANLIADINGVAPACGTPTDLVVSAITSTSATVTYTQVVGAVGYYFQLRRSVDNLLIADGHIGAVDHVDCTLLESNTAYRFYIQADCGSGNLSPFTYIDFTTNPADPSNSCGEYELFNTDDQNFHQGSYTDCEGIFRGLNIAPLHSRIICVLQSSPGTPIDLNVESEISITYNGLCF